VLQKALLYARAGAVRVDESEEETVALAPPARALAAAREAVRGPNSPRNGQASDTHGKR
jgi:hypothetical protein